MIISDLEHLEVIAEETNVVGGYTIEVWPNETLSSLASDLCGDANRWPEIYYANLGTISDPDHIEVGWELEIPC